jgi:hypothetical protein
MSQTAPENEGCPRWERLEQSRGGCAVDSFDPIFDCPGPRAFCGLAAAESRCEWVLELGRSWIMSRTVSENEGCPEIVAMGKQ